MSIHPVAAVLKPKSIAVAGAKPERGGFGSGFTAALLEQGFKGPIYPVNPAYPDIAGLKCYPSLRDVPGPVDYVISSVPAAQVLNVLADCPEKGVKVMHLFTARFSETGRPEAARLEQEILRQAKALGIRLIGPNCMGVYDPGHGMAFTEGAPRRSGSVGLSSQSGQVAAELIRNAGLRGVYFSQAISYGNAIDFNECDFLDYFAQDKETRIILAYIEGVKDGKRFLKTLCHAAATKPVIVLKGGRGKSGARATASHTASLAGSSQVWQAVINQSGAIPVENLDEMIDVATSFYSLPPITGTRVGASVGGGGATVPAADTCEEAGLDIIPLPQAIRDDLKRKGVPIWDWIGNPVDFSISYDQSFRAEHMLRMMAENPNFDFLISTIGPPFRRDTQEQIPVDTYFQPYLDIKQLKPLLAIVGERSPNVTDLNDPIWKVLAEVKAKLIDANIPSYPTIGRAARAVRKLVDYYQKRE